VNRAWVIGHRGLLGSAIAREISRRAGWELLDAAPLSWTDGLDALQDQARTHAARLALGSPGDRWTVIWAGGAAVTSSSDQQVDDELAQLRAVFAGMSAALTGTELPGAFFYASSAGGVYAGSDDPPYTELTPPMPLSPYGRQKLLAEQAVTTFATELGADCLIGRISNLYGPGQRLDKVQGLISHLAVSRVTGRPTSIYVSLDTIRDYLYVDDAAQLILDALDRLAVQGGHVTKILASGQGTTIATLLGLFRALAKRRPNVVLGTSASSVYQASDLRLRSTVWPDLDRYRPTTLPDGISRTIADVERRIRNA
jgi:UDP-glucose 4-epimerase